MIISLYTGPAHNGESAYLVLQEVEVYDREGEYHGAYNAYHTAHVYLKCYFSNVSKYK